MRHFIFGLVYLILSTFVKTTKAEVPIRQMEENVSYFTFCYKLKYMLHYLRGKMSYLRDTLSPYLKDNYKNTVQLGDKQLVLLQRQTASPIWGKQHWCHSFRDKQPVPIL